MRRFLNEWGPVIVVVLVSIAALVGLILLGFAVKAEKDQKFAQCITAVVGDEKVGIDRVLEAIEACE